jgi:hypothetical protein
MSSVSLLWLEYMIFGLRSCFFTNFSMVHAGQKEKLQWKFFSDPAQWWDCRPEKGEKI